MALAEACGLGDLECPGGVLPAGLVGAGDCAAALAVGVTDGDDPADGDGLGVRDAPADADGMVTAGPVDTPAFWDPLPPGTEAPDRLPSGECPAAC